MRIGNLAIASALFIALLAIASGFAKEERRSDLGRPVPCPHPTKLVINGHNPATIIPAEIPAARQVVSRSACCARACGARKGLFFDPFRGPERAALPPKSPQAYMPIRRPRCAQSLRAGSAPPS
jgi:hypothetical protein